MTAIGAFLPSMSKRNFSDLPIELGQSARKKSLTHSCQWWSDFTFPIKRYLTVYLFPCRREKIAGDR